MTNPDNVGGLPELPEPVLTAYTKADGVTPFWKYDGMVMTHEGRHVGVGGNNSIHLFDAGQMRAYGELCRAATAGGDWRTAPYAATDDAIRKDSGMTLHDRVEYALREAGFDHGEAARIASMSAPAGGCDCGSAATGDPEQTRHSADCATYSAPAGSGEVEELAKGIEGARDYATGGCVRPDDGDDDQKQWDVLTKAAALLRKLQQGADYVVVPRDAKIETLELMAVAYEHGETQFHDLIGPMGFAYAALVASQDQEGSNG